MRFLDDSMGGTKKYAELKKIFLGISTGLLIIVITGMSILYGVMRNLIIDQNIQLSTQSFSQVQKEFEDLNSKVNVIATQVMLDDICSGFLNAVSSERPDSIMLNRVRNQLTKFQVTNSLIESIYIYSETPDLIITSGNRFEVTSLDDFSDKNLSAALKNPEKYEADTLFLRKAQGRNSHGTEESNVYTYIHYYGRGKDAVIVNMAYEDVVESILASDILNESRLLVIDDKGERLIDAQTVLIDESAELRKKVLAMMERGEENSAVLLSNGEQYFISYIYSEENQWHYIKITRWDELFGVLHVLRDWTVGIVLVIIISMLFVVVKSSVSIIRLQSIMQKKQSPGIRQADLNQLKEGFLSDFLHSRKLFTKSQLREQMEKFEFAVSEERRYMALILKLEKPEKFKELYGEKGTYDIEFGYWNIFEEIYGKEFKITGIINRDHTLTFLLETDEETVGKEKTQEKLKVCFEQFCINQKKFIRWDFFCVGMEHSVRIEEIPEANENLKKALRESFFCPSNSYYTMEQLLGDHSGRADFQKLDVNRLVKAVRSGEQMEEVFDDMTAGLAGCSSTEYMNAVSWLGISVMRSIGTIPLNEEEVNKFLVALTRCEKQKETVECFRKLFELVRQNQEKTGVKKGVAGRLDEVKKYVEENYRDPNITLERLADEFGGSPNYMGRLFKKDTGMSVAEYINEIRLKEVMRELRETTRPAKEIAEQCGFISSNYFYTYFRKKTGLTPQTYRETWKELVKDNTVETDEK